MQSLVGSSSRHETLFHAASVDLVVPEISDFPAQPSEDVDVWWKEVEGLRPRKVAFLDERLFYLVALGIPDNVFSLETGTSSVQGNEAPTELLYFLDRLQLSMTASFVPPLAQLESRRPPSLQMTGLNTSEGTTSTAHSLAPPRIPNESHTPDGEAHLPPITPNPFPAMTQGEEQYAKAEGVVVWEGAVEEMEGRGSGKVVFQRDGRWEAVWRGEVPVAYVRTTVQNPLLSLTASVTLREQPFYERTHRKAGQSVDTASIRSGTETVRTDVTTVEGEYAEEDDDMAEMEEIDLLGGLAGGAQTMPATRLAPSIKQDLSLFDYMKSDTSSNPYNLNEGQAGPSRHRPAAPSVDMTPSTPTTLRKSYRRILSLSSGLRVRMRTLFLPQLLPVQEPNTPPSDADGGENEGDRRIVLCVEIENPMDGVQVDGFEVQGVEVDVGGKGGKAMAELVCQPEQKTGVFPLRLHPVEQYNLLYAVSISSTPETAGRGDDQRPVSIIVIGRPYLGERYPTSAFQSRWNCNLDLTSFYASLNTSAHSALPAQTRNSLIKPITTPASVVAGDKRYSVASLTSDRADSRRPGPPQGRGVSYRGQPAPISDPTTGLLVSLKVLPQSQGAGTTVRALEPFSFEVFVHNRTENVRRFKLSIPSRDGLAGKVREAWEKRRRRRDDEQSWGVDDSWLRQTLSQHLSSAPALIPLENDVHCGPLLPGASLSSRIRFLALRDGVHKLEKIRIAGLNDDFDFVLSPVLDVVVGPGIDA